MCWQIFTFLFFFFFVVLPIHLHVSGNKPYKETRPRILRWLCKSKRELEWFSFSACPSGFPVAAGWGSRSRAEMVLNPVAGGLGSRALGDPGAGRQSRRMFLSHESGFCLWGSNSNISCLPWCLLPLNVSLCSCLISCSTFQLGIPNHTLFFQDKYAGGGIYCYSGILNT